MADIIDPYELKTEIDEAQHDLEQNVGELKEAILEKVDVKARVEKAIDERKRQAIDHAVRAREIVLDLYAQSRAFVRDQPLLAVGILAGVVLLAGTAFAVRRKVAAEAVVDRSAA